MYIPEWLEIIIKIVIIALSIVSIKYIYELIKIIRK